MKKIVILCCVVLLTCSLTGCRPLYELMIQGTWKVNTCLINGEDRTGWFLVAFDNYRLTFHPDGNFTETYKLVVLPITVSGTWEITGSGRSLSLRMIDSTRVRIYAIEQITQDMVHISRNTNDGFEELYLGPVMQ